MTAQPHATPPRTPPQMHRPLHLVSATDRLPRDPLGLDDDFGPRPTPTAELPDPRAWSGQMALNLLQVAVGVRAATQVRRHTSLEVYDSLVRRSARARRYGTPTRRPMRCLAVLVSQPRDGIVDASIVLDDATRSRAVALRLTGLDGRWIVSDLVLG